MSPTDQSARERGQDVYEAYFGKRRSMEKADELDNMTIDHLFANVWSRSQLSLRDRSLITVALLSSQGRDDELARHLEGARHQQVDFVDIQEAMIHVAHYAGWAAGHHGLDIARRVWGRSADA